MNEKRKCSELSILVEKKMECPLMIDITRCFGVELVKVIMDSFDTVVGVEIKVNLLED